MRRLLAALGDPHLSGYAAIHVAGTKGKGSTVGFIAAILRAAGLQRGHVQVTPRAHRRRARPMRRGRRAPPDARHGVIPKAHADAALAADVAEGGRITYFEALTALAFARFRDRGVTHAVVEVGVGGALDATNVFPALRLKGGGDHRPGSRSLGPLGREPRAVVRAKCGIARPHRPVFLGAQPSLDAECLALSELFRRGARLVGPADVDVRAIFPEARRRAPTGRLRQTVDFVVVTDGSADGWSGDGGDHERVISGVRMSCWGRTNARTRASRLAVVAGVFSRREVQARRRRASTAAPVDDEHVRRGLERAESPGCFEVIVSGNDSGWWLVADGAHTPESAAAATATTREVFPRATKIAAVVGAGGG